MIWYSSNLRSKHTRWFGDDLYVYGIPNDISVVREYINISSQISCGVVAIHLGNLYENIPKCPNHCHRIDQ